MENKVTSPAIKGLIISLVLIVYSLIIQFGHLEGNKALNSFNMIFFFGSIIYCGVLYAKQMNHNVTYGAVFTDSFKTSAAVAAIMVVFTIISIKILFPESMDKALQMAQSEMEKGSASDEQIESAMKLTRKFFVPFAIGGALLAYIIVGVIASLIGAAAAKKNPQDPFVQQG